MPTPGEEIKSLRERLGITQLYLSQVLNRSRSTVNKIENGNQHVNFAVAAEFANAFNKIADKKNIDIGKINALRFCTPNAFEIELIVNEYLDKLSYLKSVEFTEEINYEIIRITDFITNNYVDTQKKYFIYDAIIDIYYKATKFNNCKIMIIKALELSKELKKVEYTVKLYCTLIRVYTYLNEFEQIALLESVLVDLPNNEDTKEYLKSIYHNSARAYGEIRDYKSSIRLLNKLLAEFQFTDVEFLNIKILKVYFEFKRKNYHVAEMQYLRILSDKKNLDNTILARIYIALAQIYYETKDLSNAVSYIKATLAIEEVKHLPDVLLLAQELEFDISFSKNYSFNQIISVFENFINSKCIIENETAQINAIRRIYTYCVENKNLDYLIILINLIEQKITSRLIKSQNIIDICLEICNIFKKINKVKSEEIFNSCLKIIRIKG